MAINEIKTFGIVTAQRLPDGYYYLTWSAGEFDYTERVHPYNFEKFVDAINAGTH